MITLTGSGLTPRTVHESGQLLPVGRNCDRQCGKLVGVRPVAILPLQSPHEIESRSGAGVVVTKIDRE